MTVTVGLVGCGFVAALHSRAIRGMVDAGVVDAAVVATCDTDLERAVGFARHHRAHLATTDLGGVLDDVDAVFVCTPTSSHLGIVEAAAGAGVAVFCEKPVGRTAAEAAAVAAVAERAGVPHQVGLVMRTAPVIEAARAVLLGGELGRPMAAHLRDDQYFPDQGQYGSTWRSQRSVAGGGTLVEHSIHDLDVLHWWLGDAVSVTASTANYAGHVGVEDVAAAVITFASGATATLTSVWHQLLTRGSSRRYEVFGERGLMWLDDDDTGPLHVETAEGARVVPCPRPSWAAELPIADPAWRRYAGAYAPADRAFLDAVGAGRPPWPGLHEALPAHRMADAAYESARRRRHVAVGDQRVVEGIGLCEDGPAGAIRE